MEEEIVATDAPVAPVAEVTVTDAVVADATPTEAPVTPTETPIVEEDNAEPVVRQRKTAKDFIIERQQAKIARLSTAPATEAVEEEDPDAIPDDEEERISRVIDRRFAPLIERQRDTEDSQEVEEFVKENPDFAEFATKVKLWMKHPSRSNIPARSLFYEIAGDKLLKLGAERERKASEAAKQTQTGGGTNRTGETTKGAWDMTPEEFAAEQQRVRNSM